MIFHYRPRDIGNLILSLKISNKPVERVTEFNFLGLTIDETLSWHPQVQKISNKIFRTLGIMGCLKKFLPINILILMYNSFVLLHLQLGILTWGFKLRRLDKLQKRAVRIITCQKYDAHTEPFFRKLSLVKLNDLFRLNVLKLYYKFNNGLLPIYVASIFRYDTGNDHYGLQNENVLINPEVRTRSLTKVLYFILKETWSAVMLLVAQSRIVIYAQDALKFKKKENSFTKTPEWLSIPCDPRTPHSSLHIRITVNIMFSFPLYNVIFFFISLFSIALKEIYLFLCSMSFYVYSKFLFFEMLCSLF